MYIVVVAMVMIELSYTRLNYLEFITYSLGYLMDDFLIDLYLCHRITKTHRVFLDLFDL